MGILGWDCARGARDVSLGLGLQKQEAQVLLGDDGLEEGMGLKSEFEHNSGSHKLLLLLALQHTVSVKRSSTTPAPCRQNAQAALSRAVLGVCVKR